MEMEGSTLLFLLRKIAEADEGEAGDTSAKQQSTLEGAHHCIVVKGEGGTKYA